MSDVLKIVEEALVAGLDLHIHDDNPDAVEQRIRAALTALRGLEWRPIAEMADGDNFNQATILGRWGMWYGQPPERWCLGNCGHMSKSEAIKSGYTHFCCPILPTPPKREVENAG